MRLTRLLRFIIIISYIIIIFFFKIIISIIIVVVAVAAVMVVVVDYYAISSNRYKTQSWTWVYLCWPNPIQSMNSWIQSNPIQKYLVLNLTRKLCATTFRKDLILVKLG